MLTTVNPTGNGFLVAFPANTSGFPDTSNVNFSHGGPPIANLVAARLGVNPNDPNLQGHLSIRAAAGGGTVDVIADLLGYTT